MDRTQSDTSKYTFQTLPTGFFSKELHEHNAEIINFMLIEIVCIPHKIFAIDFANKRDQEDSNSTYSPFTSLHICSLEKHHGMLL